MAYYTLKQLRDMITMELKDPLLQNPLNDPAFIDLKVNQSANKVAILTHCIKSLDETLDSVIDQAEYDTKDLGGVDTFIVERPISVSFNIDDTTWTPLDKTTTTLLDKDNSSWREADSGDPSEWYWDGRSKIGLYPAPDAVYTNCIKLFFYGRAGNMTTDSSATTIPADYIPELVKHAYYALKGQDDMVERIEQKLASWGQENEIHRALTGMQSSTDSFGSGYD